MVAQTRVRCAARQAKTLSRPGARGAVSGLGVGGVGGGGGLLAQVMIDQTTHTRQTGEVSMTAHDRI